MAALALAMLFAIEGACALSYGLSPHHHPQAREKSLQRHRSAWRHFQQHRQGLLPSCTIQLSSQRDSVSSRTKTWPRETGILMTAQSPARHAIDEETANYNDLAALAGAAADQAASEAHEARGRFLNAVERQDWAASRRHALRLATRNSNVAAEGSTIEPPPLLSAPPLPSAFASVGSVGASALIAHRTVRSLPLNPPPAYAVPSRSEHRTRRARVRMFATSCLEWLIGLDYDHEEAQHDLGEFEDEEIL